MKNILLSVFARHFGTLARWITGLLVGIVVGLLAKFGFDLDDETTAKIIGVATPAVAGILGELVVVWQGKSIEEIQQALTPLHSFLEVDKFAGPETIRAVQQTVTQVKKLTGRL